MYVFCLRSLRAAGWSPRGKEINPYNFVTTIGIVIPITFTVLTDGSRKVFYDITNSVGLGTTYREDGKRDKEVF
jgi:hypothetical protein